jgi:hypothetical protein
MAYIIRVNSYKKCLKCIREKDRNFGMKTYNADDIRNISCTLLPYHKVIRYYVPP